MLEVEKNNAYEIKSNDDYILLYSDYLDKHEGNETVGIIVTLISVCIGCAF